MSIFTCLAAARDAVLRRVGWDVAANGLSGSPRVRVVVGAQRHDTVDLALRYLGLGARNRCAPTTRAASTRDALGDALRAPAGDPDNRRAAGGQPALRGVRPIRRRNRGRARHGAWVHIDGAFGLFAAASPTTRHLTAGYERADSWTTDAHKTLNVPYDCGIAIVADRAALRAAMTMGATDYFIADAAGDPCETVPESSRRARAIPVWAVLRALGRQGVADLVGRLLPPRSDVRGRHPCH